MALSNITSMSKHFLRPLYWSILFLTSITGYLWSFIWSGIIELSFRQHKRPWSTEGHRKGRQVVEYTYSDAGRKNKGVCADSCTCWLPHLLSGVSREKRGSAGPCDTSAPCLGLLNRDTEGTEASCQSKNPQPRCASNRGHRKPTSSSVSAFVCLCGFVSLSLSHFLSDVHWECTFSHFLLRSHAVHTLSIKAIQCEERGLISALHWGSLRCSVRWGGRPLLLHYPITDVHIHSTKDETREALLKIITPSSMSFTSAVRG